MEKGVGCLGREKQSSTWVDGVKPGGGVVAVQETRAPKMSVRALHRAGLHRAGFVGLLHVSRHSVIRLRRAAKEGREGTLLNYAAETG